MFQLNSTIGANKAPDNGRDAACRFSTGSMKRVWMPLLWLFFLFVFATPMARAQDANFPSGNGDGSEGDPFQITTAAELALLATLVNDGNEDYNAANYILTGDLDLGVAPYTDGAGWTPIGDSDNSFQGVFDGNGKTITGLKIDATADVQDLGLFGFVHSGEIKNLGITGASVSGGANVGILAGQVEATIVTDCFSSGTVNGNGKGVGGLIGLVSLAGSLVDQCHSSADVVNNTSTEDPTGGLIGTIGMEGVSDIITLTNSYATGTVTGQHNIGGLLGRAYYVEISACYATGTVTARGDAAGGLVGIFYNGTVCKLSNSYATGAVSGGSRIGGLIGDIRSIDGSIIENCYATGAVSGTGYVGGIAGGAYPAVLGNIKTVLTNCIALNISVKAGGNVGRVIGGTTGVGSSIVEISNNAAWDGIVNNSGDTNWGVDAHDNLQGTSLPTNVLQQISGFPSEFTVLPWTYTTGKLPGLNGAAAEMPEHLHWEALAIEFTLSTIGAHNFPSSEVGYSDIAPLEVTVTNTGENPTGALTVSLEGENASSFVLSETSLASIALEATATFTVTPETGLGVGAYSATVTVSADDDDFSASFIVNFAVSDGDENFPSGRGDGTEDAPFQITSAAELALLATLVNAGNATYRDAHYKLMNDIDLDIEPYNAGEGWTPIGTRDGLGAGNKEFRGVFDGDGNSITGLYINNTGKMFQGLFGVIDNGGEIKNLGVSVSITAGGERCGGLAGWIQGGKITNCHTSGTITNTGTHTGGLAGCVGVGGTFGGTVTNSYSTATVIGTAYTGGLLGGFEGHSSVGPTNLSNCYTTGDVTGTTDVGGLLGYTQLSNIENTYATGTVTGTGNNVGGIIGRAGNPSESVALKNSMALNSSVKSPNTAATGRLVGNLAVGTVSNSMAFSGMLNDEDETDWDGSGLSHKNGENITAYELLLAANFPTGFNAAPWTSEDGKLPGFGAAQEMPEHLHWVALAIEFTLSPTGAYDFPFSDVGYSDITPLTVTVTNIGTAPTGVLTVSLEGANASSFDLSETSLASIAIDGTDTFTVAPETGLGVGVYNATLTVSAADDFSASLVVNFTVSDGDAGIPDTRWYNEIDDTFDIASADELAGLAELVNEGNDFTGKTINLLNNITLSKYGEGAGWTPIGNSITNSFNGVFDGNNKTITGLVINVTAGNQGLFGIVVEGEIKNLGITGASVKGGENVGILAGQVQATTVTDCFSSGTVNGNGLNVGGLIGLVSLAGSSIDKCHSSANVSNASGAEDPTGGLIGAMAGVADNLITLTNSFATGTVVGQHNVGGLLGRASFVEISACYATGTVTARGDAAGGLVGIFYNNALCKLSNSYATGAVGGGSRIGGLIGDVRGIEGSIIENCYATGAVTGTNYVGGIAGTALPSGLTDINTILTNCIALNISVKTAGGDAGRVIGNTIFMQISNNAAWDGIVNNSGSTNWGAGAHNNIQGESKSLNDLQEITGFPTGFDVSPWDYAPGKLPGLGEPADMPIHLMSTTFNLDVSGTHYFERKSPGYTDAEPLTVTVTNIAGIPIGPVTIELIGENANLYFELSTASITNIPEDDDATFTVEPKTGLAIGIYATTVKVTNAGGYYESFGVSFTVAEGGGNTGFPDMDWYVATEDIFHISLPDELAGLAQLVNGGTTFADKTVILDNDIDLEIYADAGWTPIGKDGANSFRGVFDGDGNVISGLFIDTNVGNQGLFGFVSSAEIKNLGINDASVSVCGNNNGILAGQAVSTKIENCYSSGDITLVRDGETGGRYIGGLLGMVQGEGSIVNNCYSSANVLNPTVEASVGGLIGCIEGVSGAHATLTNSYATGTATGSNYVGGLVGQAAWIDISSCYATGAVSANANGIGGLVGITWNNAMFTISNCYTTGKVNGSGYVGGLVGDIRGIEGSKIENCYTTGTVTGITDFVGGIVGATQPTLEDINTIVSNCIALNDKITGGSNVGRIIGNVRKAQVSNNAAWDGILNKENDTNWSEALHDNTIGESKTLVEIHSEGFFQGVFTAAQSVWTFEKGKLPGLEGVALEMPVHLELNVQAPEITTHPESIYVKQGNTLTLTVEAEVSDEGTLTYQWYSNATASNEGGDPIDGATANTYNPETSTLGEFHYYVVVTNNLIGLTVSATSDVATINVTEEDVTFVITLTVNKDNAAWNAHGKTFTLKDDTQTVTMTGANGTLTADVVVGTWKLYDGESDVNVTFNITNNDAEATLDYYTVLFSVVEQQGASGSTISATYNGVSINSGDAVLAGKMLLITVDAKGSNNYTYSWSGTTGTAATNSINPVSAPVNAVCTVTGSTNTGVEILSANPLKAWVNSGILNVSGLTEGKVWKLYNVSGALVKQGVANGDIVEIPLNNSGMYIIQSEGNTLKVISD